MICDDNMNELEKFDFIIKNNDKYGFNITNPEFHNITNEISQNIGIDFIEAYNVLHKYLDKRIVSRSDSEPKKIPNFFKSNTVSQIQVLFIFYFFSRLYNHKSLS